LLLVIALSAVVWVVTRRHTVPTPALPVTETHFAGRLPRVGARTEQLIDNLQAHLRVVPTDGQAYGQLGLAHLQRVRETGDPDHYQKAEGVLKKALALQPDDYAATSALGALALARHQFTAALEWGERARRINPSRTYAYGVIADAQIELGKYDEAAATLQTMVDLRPDLSAYARISYLRELYGDTEGALDMMQRAVNSGSPNAENTAWLRTQLGNLYFNSGDLSQAASEYQRALEGLPGYVYALAGLGRVCFAQGRTEEAIKLLAQAAQAIPLPEFVITLGDLYQVTGNLEAARQQYDLVHVIQRLYESNGVDLDLEMALFAADHDRDLQTTVQQARAAYARRPSISAADVLAWALYKTGHYHEAQSYAEQALRLGTRDALKFFHAGMIAWRLGDTAKAKHYLEQALTLNPHFSILFADEAHHTLNELTAVIRQSASP
jgi:tetratricopeptide (TPR) repeat protein